MKYLLIAYLIALSIKGAAQCSLKDKKLLKTAFLIGENKYSQEPLDNPTNDAVEMEIALRRLKFKTFLDTNCSRRQLEKDLSDWYHKLSKYDVAIFYFAGHGGQYNGDNYLFPIEADLSNSSNGLKVSDIQKEMENHNEEYNILILDACRENLLRGKTKTISRNGFKKIPVSRPGVLVCYPVGPGEVVDDGSNGHSTYTQAVLDNIEMPNTSISKVFRKVADETYKASGAKKQTPHTEGTLGINNDFCLKLKTVGIISDSEDIVGDTSNASAIAEIRRKQPVTSKKIDSLLDATAPIVKAVVDQAVQDVLDTIGPRYKMMYATVQTDYWHSRLTYWSGIYSDYYGSQCQFRPIFSADMKSNEVTLMISNAGLGGAQLLDDKMGLPHGQVFSESITDIDWQKIRVAIRKWYLDRLELLAPPSQ